MAISALISLATHLTHWVWLRILSRGPGSPLPQPASSRRAMAGRSMTWKHRRCYPPCKFICSVFLICAFLLAIFLAVTCATIVHEADSTGGATLWGTPGVWIAGEGLRINPDTQELSVLWRVVACGVPGATRGGVLANVSPPERCRRFDQPLDVYLNNPSKPVFSYHPDELTPEISDTHDQSTFAMSHRIYRYHRGDPLKQLFIPFERYVFHASAFAINPTTNHSHHVHTFAVTGFFGDFVLGSHDAHSTKKFSYDSGNGSVTTDVASRLLEADIKRSLIAKVFSTSLLFLTWTLVVVSVYTTSLVVLGKIQKDDVLAPLPVYATSAIFTIRAFSSSPPFGISIDQAAFFVQILIVSSCCLILLFVHTRVQSPP